MEALAGRLVRLLEARLRIRIVPIGRLDILAAERARRPSCGAGTTPRVRGFAGRRLPELFAAQAATRPDATAVVFEDASAQLRRARRRANRLAHHLRELGRRARDRGGVCALSARSSMIVGLLGILKAGGAYLPLDPEYPRERLAFMLADAGLRGAGHAGSAARSPSSCQCQRARRRCVRLDADAAAIAAQPRRAPLLDLDPHHPAYVIYTSGSTGIRREW